MEISQEMSLPQKVILVVFKFVGNLANAAGHLPEWSNLINSFRKGFATCFPCIYHKTLFDWAKFCDMIQS